LHCLGSVVMCLSEGGSWGTHRLPADRPAASGNMLAKCQTPSKRRTDAASLRLSRVAATSTRRDGGDRWTLLPCVFVRPSVRLLDGVWH